MIRIAPFFLILLNILFINSLLKAQSISVAAQKYCGPATVQFTANGPNCADYKWYDQASGGTLLGTGCNFTSPETTFNQRYFVVSPHLTTTEPGCATIQWFDSQVSTTPIGTGCNFTETGSDIKNNYYVKQPGASFTTTVGYAPSQFTGSANGRTHFWTTNSHTEKYAAYFDVKQNIVLNSVDVDISRFNWIPCSVFFRIELRDQNNTLLQSSNPSTPCGSGDQIFTIPLGWSIPPDVNYSLKLVNVYNNQYIYVTTSGADYSVGGPLDNPYLHITSGGKNMSPNANPNAWGGLFNWNITVDPRIAIPNPRVVAFALDTCNLTCGDSIDLNTWTQRGDPASGNWSVTPDGHSVFQSVNAPSPTFFVSPEEFINVQLTGSFVTTDADNDWMGFVFGYRDPINNPTSQIYHLFDWAKDVSFGSHLVNVVMIKDLTTVNHSTNASDFWLHQTGVPGFNILSSNTGSGSGWQQGVKYDFVLDYTSTHVTIVMNGGTYSNDTIVNLNGCFQPGRFGFYNFSQANVTYSDFTWKMIADYNLSASSICLGEPVDMTALQNTSCGGGIVSNIAQWSWEISDGTSTLDTNINDYIFAQSGNYTIDLTIKDTVGCQAVRSKSINVLPGYTPSLSPEALAICSGSSTDVLATSYLGASYEWFNVSTGSLGGPTVNDSTESINNVGEYYVKVTGSLGCDGLSDTISLSVDTDPTPSITPNQIVCYNDTTTFTTLATANDLEWSVTLADSVSAVLNTFQVGAQNQDFTVEVIESTPLGCSTKDQLLVNVNTRLDTSNYTINCNANDFTVQFDLTGGDVGTYSITGLNGSFIGNTWTSNAVPDGSSFAINISDQYRCNSIIINDQRQCSCVDTAYISGDTTLCGTSSSAPIVIDFNQTGNFGFELLKDGLSDSIFTNVSAPIVIPVSQDGNYTLVNVSQTCLGTGLGSASVVFNPLPSTPTISTTGTACPNDTISLSITNGEQNVIWTTPNSQLIQNDQNTATLITDVYQPIVHVQHETTDGCISMSIDTLIFSPQSTPPSLTDISICQFETIPTIAAIGQNIIWYSNNAYSNSTTSPPTLDSSIITQYYVYASQQVTGECISAIDSSSVTVNALPSSLATQTFDYCLNETASTITIAGNQIQWYADSAKTIPVNAITPSTSNTGSSNYFVAETANGCESLPSRITIDVHGLPSPQVTAAKDSACPREIVAFSYSTTSGSSYSWKLNGSALGGSNPLNIVLPSTGSAEVFVVETNSYGCIDSSSATVIIYDYTLPLIIAPDTSCLGALFNVSTTDRGGNYLWASNSPNISLVSANAEQATFISSNPGNYEIELTEVITGCTLSTSESGVIEGATEITLNLPSTVCELASPTTLTATPVGGTFTGDGVIGANYDQTTGTTPAGQQHFITYTFSSTQGCISEDSAAITIISAPNVTISGDSSICGVNGSFELNVNSDQTGPLSFDLLLNNKIVSTESNVSNPYQIYVVDSGTYTLSNVNQNCFGNAHGSAQIKFQDIPSSPVLTTTGAICLGATVDISASGVLNDLQWTIIPPLVTSSIGNELTINGLSGKIQVTATHAADNGCRSSVTEDYTISASSPQPLTQNVITCQNSGPVELTATGTNLRWYTSQDTNTALVGRPTLDGNTAGVFPFFCTQQLSNFCISEFANGTITINSEPSAPLDQDINYCLNQNTTPISVLGNHIKWYSDSAAANEIVAITPESNLVATTIYYATQTIDNCESPTGRVTVNIIGLPNPSLTASKNTGCPQESITYTAQISSGSHVSWFENGEDLETSSLNTNIQLPNSGHTTIQIIEIDVNGCSESDEVTVNTFNDPVQELPQIDTNCINDKITLSVADRSGSFDWSTSGSAIEITSVNQTSVTLSAIADGPYSVSLIETVNGCTLNSTVSGVVTAPEDIVLNLPTIMCEDHLPIELMAFPIGGSFSGLGVNGSTFDPKDMGNTHIDLSYTFTTKHGCESNATQSINIQGIQDLNLTTANLVLCEGASTLLTWNPNVDGDVTWFKNDNAIAETSATLNTNQPGTYYLTSNDGICTNTSNQLTIDRQQVSVELEDDVNINEHQSLTLEPEITITGSMSDYSTTWFQNGQILDTSTFLQTTPEDGLISLEIVTEHGCTANITSNITVVRPIKIPNAFTPNQDGEYDVWHIQELEKYTDISLRIFNRWGDLVFESYTPTDWDGNFNGKPLPVGTYYYVLYLPLKDEPYNGDVSIIR